MVPSAILAVLSAAWSPPTEPNVMILGCYDFANPALDVVKTEIRDTLGRERQKEIEAVIGALERYRPTQICVEAPYGSIEMHAQYRTYLNGDHALAANETEQLGFRLGKQCGLATLIPVDYRNEFDFNQVMEFATVHRLDAWSAQTHSALSQIGSTMQLLDAGFSVGDILAAMNDERSLRFSNGFYLSLVDVNDGVDYPGQELAANWYARNLRIFANIRKAVGSGQDRILVIVGSGHAPLLREFVRDSRDMRLIDVSQFLGKPPPRAVDLACGLS